MTLGQGMHAVPDPLPRGGCLGGGIEYILGLDVNGAIVLGQLTDDGYEAVDLASARSQADDLCSSFLTNPVIEDASVSVSPVGGSA